MGNINYAAQYAREIANAYPYLSYYGDMWNGGESRRFRPLQGKTVYIAHMTTTGATAVNRDSIDGNWGRNFDLAWEPKTLSMDREWKTLVDPLDIMETNEVATIANVTASFNEQQKLPEMDAYASSKLAGFAMAHGGVVTTTPDASNILTLWDNALAYMAEQRVNRDRVHCMMIPSVYKLLKEASGLTRFVETNNGIANVDRNIAKLDGVVITEIPAELMKTAYNFTTGWAIGGSAAQVNMLFYDPVAVAAPVIYDTSMMTAPSAQSKGRWLYYERYYYDVFALDERQAGFYAVIGSASKGSLTVTSVAGTVASGDTVITVSGAQVGSNGLPVEGITLKYCAGQTGEVSTTYGAVPDASKTWVAMTANPLTIGSQTANKVITVVAVNDTTGFVVASGYATEVVKA